MVFFYGFGYLGLGVLGAAEQILLGVDHIRQGSGKLDHGGHIHKPGDIGTAAAHKNTDARGFSLDVDFFG